MKLDFCVTYNQKVYLKQFDNDYIRQPDKSWLAQLCHKLKNSSFLINFFQLQIDSTFTDFIRSYQRSWNSQKILKSRRKPNFGYDNHQSIYGQLYNASYNHFMMRLISVCVLLLLLALTLQLPFKHQIALVNSLEVGRLEDPMSWTCVGCDDDTKPIHSYVIEEKAVEIRSILSVYEEYTVLAFRYTANLQNVWQDVLWAFQTQDEHAPKGCKVQREYDRMWATIKNDVLAGLREHVHTKRLIITGISLGGGLACISFVDIQALKEFNNIEVITFGAPRVGNKQWAEWFDTLTDSTRIYITEDPIAFLPRCLTFVCNYRQTGNPIVCYPGTQQCVCKDKNVENVREKSLSYILSELAEHKEEIKVGEFGGILDHVYGYKKTKDYALVC